MKRRLFTYRLMRAFGNGRFMLCLKVIRMAFGGQARVT